MKKEELIDLLRKGLYWEDEFIIKYDNPSFWTLIKSSVSKEKFGEIKKLFSHNIKETYEHKEILQNLSGEILKSSKNEY